METIVLKTFDNYFTANIMLSKLQDVGINCYLKDEYTVTIDPILSNAIGGIKLAVDSQQADEAAAFIARFQEDYLRAVICPKCSSHAIEQVSRPGVKTFITPILTWQIGRAHV